MPLAPLIEPIPATIPAAPATRAFARELEAFRCTYRDLWRAAPTSVPALGRRRTVAEQRATESQTDRFLDRVERELRRGARDPRRRERTERRLEGMIRDFAADAGLMPAAQLERVAADDFFAVTAAFLREARAFDPRLAPEDLFQALRNVWIMNLIQELLGLPVALTPPMVGYSLLYPFTDNRLDDPAVDDREKRAFCARLGRRLEGEEVTPVGEHERAVFALVARIEAGFPRGRFPDIYRSLLAIHDGQVASLRMQRSGARDTRAILDASVAKGGASVLADGYLVAGDLDRETADFCFGYGAVLQLIDDLQDIDDDRRAGHRTLFADDDPGAGLDARVARLVHYLDAVLDRARRPGDSDRDVLLDLVRDNCTQMILFAAGRHPGRLTPALLAELEAHALVRFAYAERFGRTVHRRLRRLEAETGRQEGAVSASRPW